MEENLKEILSKIEKHLEWIAFVAIHKEPLFEVHQDAHWNMVYHYRFLCGCGRAFFDDFQPEEPSDITKWSCRKCSKNLSVLDQKIAWIETEKEILEKHPDVKLYKVLNKVIEQKKDIDGRIL